MIKQRNKFTLPLIKRLVPSLKPHLLMDLSEQKKVKIKVANPEHKNISETRIHVDEKSDNQYSQSILREGSIFHSRNRSMSDILNQDLKQIDFDSSLSSLKYLHTKPLNKYFNKQKQKVLDSSKIEEQLSNILSQPKFRNEFISSKDINFELANEELEGLHLSQSLHQSFDANKSVSMLILGEH